MLRDKNLIPLSRQHQHALALCVRIDRATQAGEVDLEAWQAEIQQIVEQEIAIHFEAEERELFPVAASDPKLQALVEELLDDHRTLRSYFSLAVARTLDQASLRQLAKRLSAHIRKEERQLFEALQKTLSPEELAAMGAALETDLSQASEACLLPNDATRMRPKNL